MSEEKLALFTRMLCLYECPSCLCAVSAFLCSTACHFLCCNTMLSLVGFFCCHFPLLFSLSLPNHLLFSFLPPKLSCNFPQCFPAVYFHRESCILRDREWEAVSFFFFLHQLLLRKFQLSVQSLTLILDPSPSLPEWFSPTILLYPVVFLLFYSLSGF